MEVKKIKKKIVIPQLLVGYSNMSLLGASLALAAGFMAYISIEELIPASEISKHPRLSIASLISGAIQNP